MTPVHIACVQTFILNGIPIKLKAIDEVCERFYRGSFMEVTYLILSKDDLELLTKEVAIEIDPDNDPQPVRIIRLINHTTGHFMDVFTSDTLNTGTILFGTCKGQSSLLLFTEDEHQ